VLLLRGCVSLHASAIAIDNSAVAIVGPAGSGKSTTAAALADLGYSILAEDVVTLQEFETKFLVQPAYPCIRLWPASVKALYGEDAELPKLTPTWDKCYLDLTQEQYQFQTNALPLAAIYLLDERSNEPSAPQVFELSPGEGLISLIANTYASYLMDKAMRAREFELLGRVFKSVPVRKVIPHTDPKHIQMLCKTIIMDFEKLNSPKGSTEPLDHAVHV
jgi:energy-coupling factor transporter ATP-binding protein EcfA2